MGYASWCSQGPIAPALEGRGELDSIAPVNRMLALLANRTALPDHRDAVRG